MEHALSLVTVAGVSLPVLLGVRLLLAGEGERDNLRERIGPHLQMSRARFERFCATVGYVFLVVGLSFALLVFGMK